MKPNSSTPPHDEEYEKRFLGCMMTSPLDLAKGCEAVSVSDIYCSNHATIFETIKRMNKDGLVVDPGMVIKELKHVGRLDEVGGYDYIIDLAAQYSLHTYIDDYIDVVKENSHSRQVIELLHNANEEIKRNPNNSERIFERLQRKKNDIDKQLPQSNKAPSLGEILSGNKTLKEEQPNPVIDRIQARFNYYQENKKPFITGIPTGFRDLDSKVTLLEKTNLIVVAGRPAMGKTAFALNVAAHVCFDQNLPIGFISLEMSADQLAERLLSLRTQVSGEKIKRGTLSKEELSKLEEAEQLLRKAPFFIHDTAFSTVYQVTAAAKRLKDENNIQLLVIDYLQLLGTIGSENRQNEVAEVSRSLKKLAMDLAIPVICVAQLSRKVEERVNKKPLMSDLRDSGQIEQDSDAVVLLYRESYYDKKESTKAEVIVAKNRHGPETTSFLSFEKESGLFKNLTLQKETINY